MRIVSFNRTFMELKYGCNSSYLSATRVLIVPLWNWNTLLDKDGKPKAGFNRTFMELKLNFNFKD